MLFSLTRQLNSHFSLHRWSQQTLVAIFHRFLKLTCERRSRSHWILLNDIRLRLLERQRNTDAQHVFVFRSIECEYAMRDEFTDTLAEFIIPLIDTIRILFSDFFVIDGSG